MKILFIAIFVSMNAFGAVYDCDLTDGDADWQRVTVKTDLEDRNVSSVSLSSGGIRAKIIEIRCKKTESQNYLCTKTMKNKKLVVLVDFQKSRLALKVPGSDDVGLYACFKSL
jgi:hypothetical protein